jgi:hypothetical protein
MTKKPRFTEEDTQKILTYLQTHGDELIDGVFTSLEAQRHVFSPKEELRYLDMLYNNGKDRLTNNPEDGKVRNYYQMVSNIRKVGRAIQQ